MLAFLKTFAKKSQTLEGKTPKARVWLTTLTRLTWWTWLQIWAAYQLKSKALRSGPRAAQDSKLILSYLRKLARKVVASSTRMGSHFQTLISKSIQTLMEILCASSQAINRRLVCMKMDVLAVITAIASHLPAGTSDSLASVKTFQVSSVKSCPRVTTRIINSWCLRKRNPTVRKNLEIMGVSHRNERTQSV